MTSAAKLYTMCVCRVCYPTSDAERAWIFADSAESNHINRVFAAVAFGEATAQTAGCVQVAIDDVDSSFPD